MMIRETAMRLHLRCRQESEEKPRPKEYVWYNTRGWTHVYDVGFGELEKLSNLFDIIELISYGKYYNGKEKARVDLMCGEMGIKVKR